MNSFSSFFSLLVNNGKFAIRNEHNDRILDLFTGTKINGGNRIGSCSANDDLHTSLKRNQQWVFNNRGGHTYEIKDRHTENLLDVLIKKDAKTGKMVQEPIYRSCFRVGTRPRADGNNQLWKIEKREDGYIIKSEHNGLVLDLFTGANLFQNNCNHVGVCPEGDHKRKNQLWDLEELTGMNPKLFSYIYSNMKLSQKYLFRL